ASQHLVRRATDQTDRRRNIITITATGRAHLARLNTLLADVQDELLAPLSPGERQALAGALTRVLDHHAGPPTLDPGRGGPPPGPYPNHPQRLNPACAKPAKPPKGGDLAASGAVTAAPI